MHHMSCILDLLEQRRWIILAESVACLLHFLVHNRALFRSWHHILRALPGRQHYSNVRKLLLDYTHCSFVLSLHDQESIYVIR